MSEEFWQNKIKAFFHDPPDKALILFHKPHEERRDNILDKLGLKYDKSIDPADRISSAMQRVDIPSEYRMDKGVCSNHICFKGTFKPVFKHTLSGELENFGEIIDFIGTHGYEKALDEYGFNPEAVEEFLDENNWKKTYFLLWRFLPEKYQLGYFLPADTRVPDHGIWDHLEVTAAISSCLGSGLALLATKLPAVQEFISHSRKLADLWAASHVYSTIIFAGIKAIIEEYGPDVVIYPQLRGNPMMDLTEFNGNGKFTLLDYVDREKVKECLKVSNFPNTFLCLIPFSKAEKVSKKVERAIEQKWEDMAHKAQKLLEENGVEIDEALWDAQIKNAIEVTSVWLEFLNFDRFNNLKNDLPGDLREYQEKWLDFTEDSKSHGDLRVERHGLRWYKVYEGDAEKLRVDVSEKNEFVKFCNEMFDIEKAKILESLYGSLQQDPSHFYSITFEILGIILAQKSRFWKAWEEQPISGRKCLMCGRRAALVEKSLDGRIYRYWKGEEKGWKEKPIEELKETKYLLKEGERLCAVCLTKRLYGFRAKSIFEEIFDRGFKPPEQESVVEIAARDFIEKAETDKEVKMILDSDMELVYKHEWEEKEFAKSLSPEVRKKFEELWKMHGEPNKHYAILMMDGDRIGKMLSGETLPEFGEFLHPKFKKAIEEWKENGKEKGGKLIKMKRILTPSHHIAISRAMKNFSLYVVPKIVEKYKGFLIYAGGDDILALFSTDKVLDAAREIQEFFKKDLYEIDGKKMGFGNKASMSAGIVFVHYKWPLYDAIERVREAERKAKSKYGRNAFCITFIKRSGEILTAGGKWDFITHLTHVVKSILARRISHQFIHDLMDSCDFLSGDMLKAEVRRLLKRRKEKASDDEVREIQGRILCLIEKYDAQSLPSKELVKALKILYDAYRGEER